MRETFLMKVPVGGTVDVDMPAGRVLVLTRACLELAQGAKIEREPPCPCLDWVTLSCAKAVPTSQGLPEFHAVAALAWPMHSNADAASMSCALQLVLDGDASFAAAWNRLAGATVGGGGALPGVEVHLSGWYESQ